MRSSVAIGTAAVVALLMMGAWPGVVSANIVVNPGFETGDFTGWTHNPSHSGRFPWRVDMFGGRGPGVPHSGSFYANEGCIGPSCISTGPGGNWLFQDLTTVSGEHYDLSFAYDPFEGGPTELDVLWGGTSVFDFACGGAAQPPCATTDPGYTVHSVSDLVASSTSTQLMFLGRQDPRFDGLDDISVEVSVIPEPSSLLLLGSVLPGVVGMGALRLRRRRGARA